MKHEKCGFSVVIAVGPGDREFARLEDVLEGLLAVEAENLINIVIVDDSMGRWDYSALRETSFHASIKTVVSPRAGRGDGWRGGLVTNTLFGMKAALQSSQISFVLKLDTDSFIIGPVFEKLSDFFSTHPGIGVAGSCYQYDLHGAPVAPSTWKVNLKKHAKLFRLRRNPYPHIEQALFGRKASIRKLLLRALATRWDWGACAQGGGYAVSSGLLQYWQERSILSDDLLWLDTDLGEDVVVSLLCFAAGMRVADFNQTGGVFGVQYRGLGLSIEELFRRGYGVIHSTKIDDWEEERELRKRLLALTQVVALRYRST
jgi:hypothetical protein